jgi:dUTPase
MFVIGALITLINILLPVRISIYYCSGLAVKKMIDCGAGVVDADCKFILNDI